MTILAARDLHYRYPGGVVALAGCNLTVMEGEVLALLGPNGSGKTTLLCHLNGTLKPERGAIWLEGRRATYSRDALKHWRATTGLVLQNPDDQLFAGTVYQDVSFGPLNLGLADAEVRTRVERALADLRITDLADRPLHMLSLGQKRRVAIAGVLAMAPKVLVLDEPTAGLDPLAGVHLHAVLKRLVAAGVTLVFATHDVDVACAWASRVAVLARGRVLMEGAPDRVLTDPAVLREAHLRIPIALEVGMVARNLGLVDPDLPLPRTAAEAAHLLKQVAARAALTGSAVTGGIAAPVSAEHPQEEAWTAPLPHRC